jgi:hypothetical protein
MRESLGSDFLPLYHFVVAQLCLYRGKPRFKSPAAHGSAVATHSGQTSRIRWRGDSPTE